MPSVAVKSDDARTSSPISTELYMPEYDEVPKFRLRSTTISDAERKESHRASERVGGGCVLVT